MLLIPFQAIASKTFSTVEQQNFCERYLSLTVSEFPNIPFNQIKNRHQLAVSSVRTHGVEQLNTYAGFGFHQILQGEYQQKPVFIKFPRRKDSMVQVRLMKYLSDIGIGPKFYGLVHDEHGNIGIVSDLVLGCDLNPFTKDIPAEINISMATYDELQKIRKKLIEIGLIYGSDLQFRLGEDGKPFLVDPESLRFERVLPGKSNILAIDFDLKTFDFVTIDLLTISDAELMKVTGPIHELDSILKNLEALLVKRSLWKQP